MNCKVKVVPHNVTWSDKYQSEALKLKKLFGEKLHSVHQIGSTAVPQSFAKPTIDIMLLVFSLESADKRKGEMQDLGYQALGEYGIPGRRYFVKEEGGERIFNVHLFPLDHKEAFKYLLFRDYLNNYPEEAKAYSKLKQELALKFSNDRGSYVKAKAPYIKALFKRIEENPISKNYDPLKDKIDLSPYNPDWPEQAKEEIKRIRDLDSEKVILDIQHIGSTSIKGLSAKPILDIMIGVKPLEKGQSLLGGLSRMGYLFWSDNPDKTRMFFVKGMPPHGVRRTHHIHIVEYDDPRWQMRILFRDYLNAHPEEALDYKKLKENLAQFYAYDRENYTLLKSNFVEKTLEKAGYKKKVYR